MDRFIVGMIVGSGLVSLISIFVILLNKLRR